MIIREVLMEIDTAKEREFVAFWHSEYRKAMAGQKGFVGAELLKQQEKSNSYQMLLRFRSSEDAAQWRESDDHTRLGPLLKEYAAVMELRVFDLAEW
ncbi:DUF4286 family protein [Breznakiella homolactica]|uniref:Antibiotic biosynthesis monooxygenase n=1 Tax=Breznakiella homolactica TaxID=2798577 RepID=A0A7T7XLT6_9SPIR|nr:DUF4286 family protein [Breznakiella homolactica]QQO08618.1 antibiotic biosynthesis monooxygenase [Breznakiella homolactica]